ncbi:3233_t:CDS:2 [Dentiscutata heterogama]|uniref:3233_t:CDS:1 n=1 Tax=Dentiscutata heterogama TaxID=1316150 RepID=A0ACA9MVE0_9GLOM|nr:3233_t:CDS:2 [Dentiscutata heterogama]
MQFKAKGNLFLIAWRRRSSHEYNYLELRYHFGGGFSLEFQTSKTLHPLLRGYLKDVPESIKCYDITNTEIFCEENLVAHSGSQFQVYFPQKI